MLGFPRSSRLTQASDLDFVFANPTKIIRPGLVLLYRANSQPVPRLGILINKHQIPKAVDRNRIRRILRESFRQQMGLKNCDMVIVARSAMLPLENAEIRAEIELCWQKIR